MNKRTIAFVVFAVAVAAGCVRLGIWQLSRLWERRARNVAIAERLSAPPTSLADAVRDSATARFRQVRERGVFDYSHEVVLTSRTRRGAPGVHLLTPLHLVDGRTLLVNRGWVYSANGTEVEQAKWHEGDTVDVSGFLDEFAEPSPAGPVSTPSLAHGVRRLVRDTVVALVGSPLAPLLLVRRDGAEQEGEVQHPFRVEPPALDDGPHKSYALQWFAFALIGLVGTGFVIARDRSRQAASRVTRPPTPSSRA